MYKKLTNRITRFALTVVVTAGITFTPDTASAQEAYVGEIRTVGFNFCPRGWSTAAGQLLAISQYSALFSLLGTTYGGDGRTTFGLPDLRGRSVVGGGYGTGPGLSGIAWGQRGGGQTHTMTISQMASHNHALHATNEPADQRRPNGDILAFPDYLIDGQPLDIYGNGVPESTMLPASIGNTGSGVAFSIQDPYLGMYVCIALQGIYPSRN